jgi:hypothetical protein
VCLTYFPGALLFSMRGLQIREVVLKGRNKQRAILFSEQTDPSRVHTLSLRVTSGKDTYPKRFMKDLYAGNRISATASLSDSRNSVSGTDQPHCF